MKIYIRRKIGAIVLTAGIVSILTSNKVGASQEIQGLSGDEQRKTVQENIDRDEFVEAFIVNDKIVFSNTLVSVYSNDGIIKGGWCKAACKAEHHSSCIGIDGIRGKNYYQSDKE